MLENTPDVLTLKDLMCLLHIGKNKALELIWTNQIAGHKVANRWLVFASDVEEYIRNA